MLISTYGVRHGLEATKQQLLLLLATTLRRGALSPPRRPWRAWCLSSESVVLLLLLQRRARRRCGAAAPGSRQKSLAFPCYCYRYLFPPARLPGRPSTLAPPPDRALCLQGRTAARAIRHPIALACRRQAEESAAGGVNDARHPVTAMCPHGT